MSMITREQLTRYVNDGWRVTVRTNNKVTLQKPSHIAEDIARSAGYLVTAPVVLTVSVAGALLSIFCGGCCLIMDGTVTKREEREVHFGYSPEQAEFARTMSEDCCFHAPCKIVVRANEGFFDWAKPFQSTMDTRICTLIESPNN